MTANLGTPLQIYLIRHGETEWSASGQHTGRTDIPLTAHGADEARELASSLRGIDFSRVLTSPRLRARHTSELTGLGTVAEIEPDLAEWDYGQYEGQRSADIRKQRPGWNLFRDGCPGGESPDQVSGRADRLIAKLSLLDGTVVLFSHGQFGCSLAARWIGLAVIEAQHFSLGTASLSVLGTASSYPETRVISIWNVVGGRNAVPPHPFVWTQRYSVHRAST
jgi:broad specificity phosphatase PhoE